jgi:hypothetical protein
MGNHSQSKFTSNCKRERKKRSHARVWKTLKRVQESLSYESNNFIEDLGHDSSIVEHSFKTNEFSKQRFARYYSK